MLIRPALSTDLDPLWTLWQGIMNERVYFPHTPDTPRNDIESSWLNFDNIMYVAESDSKIVAGYILKPNQPGYGNHIANASYMVDPLTRGQKLGHQLCRHSLSTARDHGFRGLQFNLVVSDNLPAIKIWKDCGFEQIGTVPGGFNHHEKGYIDACIFFKDLT